MSIELEKINRIRNLDGLRGLAAVVVMAFHFTFVLNRNWTPGKIFHYGYMGVPLFFLISGFVIIMTIDKSKNLLDFWINRISRLYPPYWAAIFIGVLFFSLSKVLLPTLDIKVILVNLTMWQRFFNVKDFDGAFWSLAVEMIFYFLITIFYLIPIQFNLKGRTLNFLIFFLFLLIIFFVLFFQLNPFSYQYPSVFYKIYDVIKYLHLFVIGIIFYKWRFFGYKIKYLIAIIFLGFFNLHLTIRFSNFYETIILFICIGLFYYAIFFNSYFLTSRVVQFFGKISYSLYLVHENLGKYFFSELDYIRMFTTIKILLVSAICICVAMFIHWVFEKKLSYYIKYNLKKVQRKLIFYPAIIKE